ncbi:MAG TPA: hypothetical protein VFD74_07995, partial [Thermoleophilia bacterium]|nr:hypothetical protein [Thermoleophilia bacterium]
VEITMGEQVAGTGGTVHIGSAAGTGSEGATGSAGGMGGTGSAGGAGSTDDTGGIVTVRVGRVGESCVCESRVEQPGLDVVTRSVDIAPVAEDRLLAEELDQLGPDRVFEESLLLAAALLRLPGGELVASAGPGPSELAEAPYGSPAASAGITGQ